MEENNKSCLNSIIIGLSAIIGCICLGSGLSGIRSNETHIITATGSSGVDFEADTIIWKGSFSASADTSKVAYSKIKTDADKVRRYLLDNGITEEEIVFNSVDISRTYKQLYDANGDYAGAGEDGYQLTQGVTVTSSNLDNVEKISRDISTLLEQGVELTSGAPEYYYSKLDELKLDLIEKATQNARERVNIMAKNAGASIGKLKKSGLGVFQITAKNSGTNSYSYDGAFDTGSRHKTATITVRLEYDIK